MIFMLILNALDYTMADLAEEWALIISFSYFKHSHAQSDITLQDDLLWLVQVNIFVKGGVIKYTVYYGMALNHQFQNEKNKLFTAFISLLLMSVILNTKAQILFSV